MPASTAFPAFGTILRLYDGDTPATVIQTGNIPGPGTTNELKEVTSQTSPDRSKEWLAVLRDNKPMTIPMFVDFDDPVHQALWDAAQDGSRQTFDIIVAGDRAMFGPFLAFVSEADHVFNVADPAMRNLVIRPTGTMDLGAVV